MTQINNTGSNQRSWPIKALTAAILMGLVASSAHTNPTTINRKPIGDLEIYAAAKPGAATIFMMLDVSSSMHTGSISSDYGSSCSSLTVIPSEISTAVVLNEDGTEKDRVVFEPEGCYINGTPRFSRMVRLQRALIELLADEVYRGGDGTAVESNKLTDKGSLPDDYEIGLGYYSYNGYAGVVLVPTRKLTPDQRVELVKGAAGLTYTSGTPTAHGFAEAGAYMMGTTTRLNEDDIKVTAEQNYPYGSRRYRACLSNNTTVSYNNIVQQQVLDCNNWGDWESSHPNRGDGNKVAIGDSEYTSGKEKKIYYYVSPESRNSGFNKSEWKSKKPDGKSYASPLNDDECSGNGIYLLTDGKPYSTSDTSAKEVMNASLQGSGLTVDQCSALPSRSEAAWGCIAEYATILRNPANNPLRLPIKTAAVGFGKSFQGLTETKDIVVNGKQVSVVDCDRGNADDDIRNLCKLGERKGDNEVKTFGDGGFYYTEETAEIAASIIDFAGNLVQVINTAPSGTITIPDDPYRVANQLPYAYLPMLDPDISSGASIWKGNLKKYALNQGTLFGRSDKALYKDASGDLNEATQDLWQIANFIKGDKTVNNDIEAGGVYAQLRTPNSGLGSVRSIYVEDFISDGSTTPFLRKLSVNELGIPQGFDALVDTATYTQLNQRRLLSFLGFDNLLLNNGQIIDDNIEVKDLKLNAPSRQIKVLGGVVHSKPTAVSYSATLDDNGRITNTRDDHVLFGSMDGALHLVDSDDGKESYAIIPKHMLKAQPEALVENSLTNKVGEPYFGVDAPWLVTTDYKYDLDNSKVTVDTDDDKGMFAYGGLRMGGEAFYGIDISDKSNPKIKFSITPDSFNGETSTDFTRLGQIWSKPTAAKIRLTKGSDPNKNTAATDVLIFAGGYDMSYEDPEYVATSAAPAKGNAIYMIDAKDGKLLWSTSAKATDSKGNKNAPTMIHSITGEITVLDRDNDGLMDHLYAADLGGQVFRADFENARIEQFGFEAVDKFSSKGMTRILKPTSNDKYAYRFYNRPVVSFYRNTGGYDNGNLFALVNVISGNRSAPLSTLRDDNKYANRIYGIIDTDITSPDLYKDGFTAGVKDLADSDLLNLANELDDTHNADKKQEVKQKMLGEAKSASEQNGGKPSAQGWYYPLTRFDGYEKVRYNKGVGDMAAINNILYTTVYNPDKLYGTVSSCAARIMGGSERQLYCLPYGICMDETSQTGTGGYIPAGQGIQELTLGAYNADNKDVKVLIGTTTIAERIKAANRAGYGSDSFKNDSNIKDLYPGTGKPVQAGGDGSATEFLFNERYTLQPKAWYQQNSGQ